MKKLLLLAISAMTAVFAVACHEHAYKSEWSSDAKQHWHEATCCEGERGDAQDHNWQASGVDGQGNVVYVCSTCSYEHQHAYDAEVWAHNSAQHWHPATCGHADAPVAREEHDFAGGASTCSICSFNKDEAKECEVAFSYFVVNDKGQPVADAEGAYTQVGVTYTSLQEKGSVAVDTQNGGVLYAGDKISFTVKKSVFCYYTDQSEQPLVEVFSGDNLEDVEKETLEPDRNGVYTVEIKANTVISVANVATRASTIKGKGSQSDPFTINSVTDWLYFSQLINDKDYYMFDYNVAYWKLNCDLDFEGEQIYVVGDGMTTASSVFCGNFDGNGHTLSNFVLDNSVAGSAGQYAQYVGVFGVISGYTGIDSVVANLTVKDFTINAVAGKDNVVSVGGILGFGAGANVRNCTVRNGSINVTADTDYMSYAGGVVGYLQSALNEESIVFFASVGYSSVENVEIHGSGMLYNAGGIAGRILSQNSQVTSFIYNCHASGNISGAMRAGGIVGEAQRFSSVQNCYSTATVSAHSIFTDAVIEKYAGTSADDRYSYAGGLVGYAENDTVVSASFFNGKTYATALAGSSFAKKGAIVAGASEAGYSDYTARKAVLMNNASETTVGETITTEYLKNQLKWSEVDWVFSAEGYPTINKAEGAHTFNVTIKIDGGVKETVVINSLYIPMAYWNIIGDNESGSMQGIPSYLRDTANANKRTYGYFFDEALTDRVPSGYVPTFDITLYAGYANTADVAGEYHFSNNGVRAKITLSTDGTYTYEEGAIFIESTYEYDGEVITFPNAFFSRMAETATQTQRATYYSFWANVDADGNLLVYDCDEQYVVTEDEEEMSSAFVAMARFYEKENPLMGIAEDNVRLSGGYYYEDGTSKNVFTFHFDGTGEYRYTNGKEEVVSAFEYVVLSQNEIEIAVAINGRIFTANLDGEGNLLSFVDARGGTHTAKELDAFVGTWEKRMTSHKVYTFDGMGGWSYQHYVYLVQENVVSAIKQTVAEESGTYTVAGGVLTFTRQDGTEVTVVRLADGSLSVKENGSDVDVKFTGEGGFAGEWYTAGNKLVRYRLNMHGVKNGVGLATLSDTAGNTRQLRYVGATSNTVYLYVGDAIYAVLTYDTKENTVSGLFYDTGDATFGDLIVDPNTGAYSVVRTFYLIDDFYGEWVSDVQGLEKISFNGLGGYDTKDSTGTFLAVQGSVEIGANRVPYAIDRETGVATFTYQGVSYSLIYNEYTNTVSVSYAGGTGVMAQADEYVNLTLQSATAIYLFDGRGRLSGGGTALVNGVSATYVVDGNGMITISGAISQTITPLTQAGKVIGYQLSNGEPLYVANAFTGTWAIYGMQASIEIGNVAFLPQEGELVQMTGTFNGNAVTVFYDGGNFVYFDYDGVRYTLSNVLAGNKGVLVFSYANEEYLAVTQDGVYGVWTATDGGTLTFNGCGNSEYAKGTVEVEASDGSLSGYFYAVEDGVVTLYRGTKVYATFVACSEGDAGAYENGGRFYKIVLAND